MDREQTKAQNKLRQLVGKAAKEKSLEQLELLLPSIKEWIFAVSDSRGHSRWFWQELEAKMEKEYEAQRFDIQKVIKGINEVPAQGTGGTESKKETKTTKPENLTSTNTKEAHTPRKPRARKKDV